MTFIINQIKFCDRRFGLKIETYYEEIKLTLYEEMSGKIIWEKILVVDTKIKKQELIEF